MTTYRPFIVKDPEPWFDQFVKMAEHLVKRSHGSSVEFVVNGILEGCKSDNCLILAATPEAAPDRLVAWMGCTFVPATYQPWVELWGLSIKPGLGRTMRDMCLPIIVDWARWKGAVRITAIITRNEKAYLRYFLESIKFVQTGIVIERRL